MMSHKIIKLESRYIMPTYSRPGIVLSKGRGMYAFDKNGGKYLDFIGGIATCSVGHSNTKVRYTINSQAGKLLNATNLYYTEPQALLAEKLSILSGFRSKVFFTNSGTEAVETAIKLARKATGKPEIIATRNSFHGRTFGALSATWKPRFKKAFAPLVPGFRHITYNNPRDLAKSITGRTAAFIVEPVQGEAGVIIPDDGYLNEVSRICREKEVLLIIDEVQTGMGRTGTFFAYLAEKIKPDIVAIAKGLANGIPIGATIAKANIANTFERGDHGNTFGGNSLATAVAHTVIDYILKHELMDNAKSIGGYFVNKLRQLMNKFDTVKDVRGKGLMIGLEVCVNAGDIVSKCLEKGLLVGSCEDRVIRFLPPLVVAKKDVDNCYNILDKVFTEIEN